MKTSLVCSSFAGKIDTQEDLSPSIDANISNRIVWQSPKKSSKLPASFFGTPFESEEIMEYECIHAGKKRVHKMNTAQQTVEVENYLFLHLVITFCKFPIFFQW